MQAKIISLLEKEYPHAKYYLNFSNPLELMVAAIMSAQARDEIVNATTKRLFRKYKTANDYANADLKSLANDISAVTFAGNKAKYIKEACKILVERHGGKVPKTMDELTTLPGIGRKTANSILQNAFDIVTGIVIDTHCIRLGYRLGWIQSKNPDIIEKDFMDIISQRYWKRIPHLLKVHGRAICRAPIPSCSKCVLNKLCPKCGVTKKY